MVIMHHADNCTTYTADDATCTVAAVKKAVGLFVTFDLLKSVLSQHGITLGEGTISAKNGFFEK